MKKCNHCQEFKPYSEFHRQAAKLDGYRSTCKQCRESESSAYYAENSDNVKERWRMYRKENPDYQKSYYTKNATYFEEYRQDHREHYHRWRQENREHLAEYRKRLKESDPNFKVACSLRSYIASKIRKSNTVKTLRSTELLGCSFDDFRKYLEKKFLPGMSWDNYGEWHIDHIIPCSKFDLTQASEQKRCFHYTNQQPLWKIDNLRKGNRTIDLLPATSPG